MKKIITVMTVTILLLATTACSSDYGDKSYNRSSAEERQLIKDLHKR